jgi:hypothetical protein
MAKISITNIQPAGASLFADDDSFISELSDREMHVQGGGKSKKGNQQTFNFGLILDPCFGGYQVGAFLNFGGGGTKKSKGGGSPAFSLAIPLGGRPAFPPYGFPRF